MFTNTYRLETTNCPQDQYPSTKLAYMSQPPPSPAALEFPKPPSFKETQADPAATLAWLKENVATIYLTARTTSVSQGQPPTLTISAYSRLYTTAHNYCEITKHARSTKPSEPKPLSGENLYCGLEGIIKNHCSEIRASLPSALKGDTMTAVKMIQEYLAQWNIFSRHLEPVVAHVMRHLDRYWIQRVIDEKRKDVYTIQDLHTVIWKEEILFQGSGDSTTAAASSVRSELERAVRVLLQEDGEDGGESGNSALVEQFLGSLRTIGVDLKASV
jgi:hypothetical protein